VKFADLDASPEAELTLADCLDPAIDQRQFRSWKNQKRAARRMTGFFATLTDEQQKAAALAYTGDDHHGGPMTRTFEFTDDEIHDLTRALIRGRQVCKQLVSNDPKLKDLDDALSQQADRYDALVTKIEAEAATSPVIDCTYCGDSITQAEIDGDDVEATTRQWKCPCCGNWNDRNDE
jgi:hypothetical protein